jgi:hypothetical protein
MEKYLANGVGIYKIRQIKFFGTKRDRTTDKRTSE